ncbi:L,D-transpeptidase [Rhodalgimonas zhirmunskyi]|uniref:L,D-transpeptidase n=1 Tax=Rhodalgimonas zhirmunskyi TaxID=2964767 RepID=A0AAJ1U8U4_9RHOB|nr:L,D-transpeptidase [Rhodoalgimonas zhirmunskyi]MDQ2093915.1 L,D-transpeptidase [Rhodoalgimonas zhirmunskyi]
MRRLALLAALAILALAPGMALAGQVLARIDLSEQSMIVKLDGETLYSWPVSTARKGKFTPVGTFGVQSMVRDHRSTLYHNAPMPWSIFFRGNFAIHGTTQISQLGTPASAGCVRLHPDNARTLYNLVLSNGRANTVIQIVP